MQREVFVNFDLMSLGPLPFEDNCAEIVYSSHTVEHISDAAAENLFREAYRILKPPGILRFSTPDFDLEHLAYKRGDRLFFYWMMDCPEWPKLYRSNPRDASLHQIFLEHFATQLTELAVAPARIKHSDNVISDAFANGCPEETISRFTGNCTFDPNFPGSHINWWNYRKAERLLRTAGFSTVYRSGYGQSSANVLRDVSLFDNTHPRISLYVEAIKS
jgi:SAM-dependent methyltransferase